MVRSDRQIIQFNRCELWRGSRVEKGKYQRERFTRERGEYIVSLFIFINMNQKIVSIPQLQVSDFFGRQRQTFRNQQISKKSGYRMEARGVSICKSFIPVKEIRPAAEIPKGKSDKLKSSVNSTVTSESY